MIVRKYKAEDLNAISNLFYKTVHTVNAKDYCEKQLFAWAKSADDLKARAEDLKTNTTLIAESDGEIAGFGSIDKSGYLDLLFVRKDFQNMGVATALCNELEKDFEYITTFSSITARPFFEKRGYVVSFENYVDRYETKLLNFKMEKRKI